MRSLCNAQEKDISYLKFWFRSISLHAVSAPIFFVGAFSDAVSSSSDKQKIDRLLKSEVYLSGRNSCPSVVQNEVENLCFFPIDNSTSSGIDLLRARIEETTLGLEHVTREVSWNKIVS